MSIFSNIWEKIKSIPEQYKAIKEMGLGTFANVAKGKLTASLGIQPKPTFHIRVGEGLTPQATQQAYKAISPNSTTSGYIHFAPQKVQDEPFASEKKAWENYYQPSITQPTTTYQQQKQQTGYSYTPYQSPIEKEYIPPPQAPSGETGISYQQYQAPKQAFSIGGYSYTPSQAPSGVSGIASHTGLLGGVSSGLGLPSVTPTDEEEEITLPKQKGAYINQLTQQSFPIGQASPGYTAQGQPISPTIPAPTPSIEQKTQLGGYPITTGLLPTQPTQPTGALKFPSIVTPEGAIDLSASQAGINQVKELLKSPLTKQTQSQVLEYLENSKNIIFQALQQAQPLPEEPILKPEVVAETQDQLDKLQQFEQTQYENIQRALGIPQTITDLENAIKELQATDQAFSAIIEDINSDPDFPKGLARRRIQAIEKEKGVRITALQNKIQLLQTTLEMKRQEFADRLGITQRAIQRQISQQEEQRKLAQNQVNMLISSEGIGEMSDAELAQLAQAAGYTLSSLKRIRDAVKSQSQAKLIKAQNDLIKQQHDMELATQREARLQAQAGQGGLLFETPEGEVIDVATVEGVKSLIAQGYDNYAELYSWYDLNTKLTTSAIKSLLAQAGVQETGIISDEQLPLIIEKLKSLINEGKITREQLEAMLDTGKLISKGVEYSLTAAQVEQIRNAIKPWYQKLWGWITK